MRLGASLFLIAVGAILTFAINVQHSHGFNINTVGIILMIVGVVGLLISLFLLSGRRRYRTPVADERPIARDREYY